MNNWNNLVNTIKSIDDVENIRLNENKAAVDAAAKKAVKAIPYAGAALSFHDAWSRWRSGDRSGAVLSVLTGAAYSVPVVGTGLGLGMDAYGAYRDYQRNSENSDASVVQTKENKVSEVEKITKLKNTLDSISKKSIHEGRISSLTNFFLDFVPFKYQDMARDTFRNIGRRDVGAPSGGSGGGRPPANKPGTAVQPAPATATGGAGGAGGGGGSPPTVTPPALPPPGGGIGSSGGGGAVRKPTDVASDIGTQSSTGGQTFRTDTGTMHRASPTNPNQPSSTGQSSAGGAVTSPAPTSVTTRPTTSASTTGSPQAGGAVTSPAPTSVTTRPTTSASTTGDTGVSGGGAGAGGTSRPAGAGGGAGSGAGAGGTSRPAGAGGGAGSGAGRTAAAALGAAGGAAITNLVSGDGDPSSTASSNTAATTAAVPDDREQYERDIVSRSNVSGYTPGGRDDPDTPDPITSRTEVTPRDQVVTVDTQAQPERPLAGSSLVKPSGSGVRLGGDIAPTVQAGRIEQGSVLPANFGAAPQGFKFSPEQERWLTMPTQDGRPGNPNRQDPYILYRMIKKVGGPIPPLSYFKNEDDKVIAKRLGFPEVPLGNDQTLNAGIGATTVPLAQTQQQPQQSVSTVPPVQQQISQTRQPPTQTTQSGTQSGQPFQFTQAQEKWLTMPTQDGRPGNPNRQDPYILRNMARKAGGPLPPVSYFKDPEDQALARRLGFPMNESNNELGRLKELIKKI